MKAALDKKVQGLRSQQMSFSNDGVEVSLSIPDTTDVKETFGTMIDTVVLQHEDIGKLQTALDKANQENKGTYKKIVDATSSKLQVLMEQNLKLRKQLQSSQKKMRNLSYNLQGYVDPREDEFLIETTDDVLSMTIRLEELEADSPSLFPTEEGAMPDGNLGIQQKHSKTNVKKKIDKYVKIGDKIFEYNAIPPWKIPSTIQGKWKWAFRKVLQIIKRKKMKIGLADARAGRNQTVSGHLELLDDEIFRLSISTENKLNLFKLESANQIQEETKAIKGQLNDLDSKQESMKQSYEARLSEMRTDFSSFQSEVKDSLLLLKAQQSTNLQKLIEDVDQLKSQISLQRQQFLIGKKQQLRNFQKGLQEAQSSMEGPCLLLSEILAIPILQELSCIGHDNVYSQHKLSEEYLSNYHHFLESFKLLSLNDSLLQPHRDRLNAYLVKLQVLENGLNTLEKDIDVFRQNHPQLERFSGDSNYNTNETVLALVSELSSQKKGLEELRNRSEWIRQGLQHHDRAVQFSSNRMMLQNEKILDELQRQQAQNQFIKDRFDHLQKEMENLEKHNSNLLTATYKIEHDITELNGQCYVLNSYNKRKVSVDVLSDEVQFLKRELEVARNGGGSSSPFPQNSNHFDDSVYENNSEQEIHGDDEFPLIEAEVEDKEKSFYRQTEDKGSNPATAEISCGEEAEKSSAGENSVIASSSPEQQAHESVESIHQPHHHHEHELNYDQINVTAHATGADAKSSKQTDDATPSNTAKKELMNDQTNSSDRLYQHEQLKAHRLKRKDTANVKSIPHHGKPDHSAMDLSLTLHRDTKFSSLSPEDIEALVTKICSAQIQSSVQEYLNQVTNHRHSSTLSPQTIPTNRIQESIALAIQQAEAFDGVHLPVVSATNEDQPAISRKKKRQPSSALIGSFVDYETRRSLPQVENNPLPALTASNASSSNSRPKTPLFVDTLQASAPMNYNNVLSVPLTNAFDPTPLVGDISSLKEDLARIRSLVTAIGEEKVTRDELKDAFFDMFRDQRKRDIKAENNRLQQIDEIQKTVQDLSKELTQVKSAKESLSDELKTEIENSVNKMLAVITSGIYESQKESVLSTKGLCLGCGRTSNVRTQATSRATSPKFLPSLNSHIAPGQEILRGGFKMPGHSNSLVTQPAHQSSLYSSEGDSLLFPLQNSSFAPNSCSSISTREVPLILRSKVMTVTEAQQRELQPYMNFMKDYETLNPQVIPLGNVGLFLNPGGSSVATEEYTAQKQLDGNLSNGEVHLTMPAIHCQTQPMLDFDEDSANSPKAVHLSHAYGENPSFADSFSRDTSSSLIPAVARSMPTKSDSQALRPIFRKGFPAKRSLKAETTYPPERFDGATNSLSSRAGTASLAVRPSNALQAQLTGSLQSRSISNTKT